MYDLADSSVFIISVWTCTMYLFAPWCTLCWEAVLKISSTEEYIYSQEIVHLGRPGRRNSDNVYTVNSFLLEIYGKLISNFNTRHESE